MLSVSISVLSTLSDLFMDKINSWALYYLFIIFGDFILDVERSLSNLAEGSLKVIPGLSLFTLVFI